MGKRGIIATFIPQAWINDNATDIDGRTEIHVTKSVLAMPLHSIRLLQDNHDSSDVLVEGLHRHGGPFRVEVTESICEFFGIPNIRRLTKEMLDAARAEFRVGLGDRANDHKTPLNAFQRAALENYANGDFAHCESEEDIGDAQDIFLKFIISELASRQDCDSWSVAIKRIQQARDDLDKVIEALEQGEELAERQASGVTAKRAPAPRP